jgi:serine/threonine-protein kinase
MQAALAHRRRRKWKQPELEGELVAGRYAIQHLLARGGMGEVYRARDELLGRDVAIKVNRAQDDPDLTERFRREAHLAARFDHPNIVRIFDLGQTEDDCPFLVMELLRGTRFTELANEKGPMDPETVADLLEGVANALDLVHREGIVHRDLKLDNLMLVEQADGPPRPKLLDFGVALAPEVEAPRLTVDGAVVGTPLYCAPEVLIGATPDSSSDVYSLAVVAYKLLTGTAPFEELESQQMLRAKVGEDVAPPSSVRADLPPALDPLFAAALSRDPSLRPASASELIAGLRAVRARSNRLPARWTRTHFYFAGGIVSFLLAGLVLLLARSI